MQTEILEKEKDFYFFEGAGEMASLTRLFDWSETSIGSPEHWHQSLRSTLSIMLNSKFPMFLWWGDDLIQFYNDAYRPSLGNNGKHPTALGQRGEECWPEIWPTIKPLIDQVLQDGEPSWSEDQLIPIYRNNSLEDVYWTFGYSPVYTESGKVEGVLVICNETTEKVKNIQSLKLSDQRFRNLIEAAPIPMCLYIGREMQIEFVNEALLETWGRDNSVIGLTLIEAIPELEGQPFPELLDDVYTSGIPYTVKDVETKVLKDGTWSNRYFDLWYKPMFDQENKVYGVLASGVDVTDKVIARKKIEESEQNLRNIILQAPVAMCILRGPEFIVEIANERMFEIWGKSKEDMIRKPIFEGLPEAKAQGFEELLLSVFTTGKPFSAYGLATNLPRNGKMETVYLNFVYEAFREADGSISGVMAVATEVTEQVMATKKIESSETRFRLMAGAMPQFVWTSDTNGNLNYFNQSVYDYSGLSTEQIEAEGWLQIVHPDEREENIRLWLHSIQTGEDFVFNHRFKNKESEYRWQLSRAVPQKDADGVIQLWIGTSTDIHEQKLFEEELNRQVNERTLALENNNKELEKSNAALQEFAYAASHDLKEPIRKIHFFADRLKQQHAGSLNSDGNKILERLEVASERMRSLVDDLLDYSQVSRGAELFEDVDLNKKIELVLNDLEMAVQEKDASFTIENMPAIKGHRRQLQQLFQNLIGNAIKYNQPGIAPQITITSKIIKGAEAGITLNDELMHKEYHYFQVKDNGIGFEQKDAERIFQVFTRLHGNAEYRGTGVGLSIARKVVENHNGFIYAESEPGKGSSFYIGLPLEENAI